MNDDVVWGWLVVLYLWLAGIGGGAYVVAYLVHNLNGGRHRTLLRLGTYVSVPLFSLGLLSLTLDLGRPARFWHLLARFRPSSVMWVGTYFLVIGTVVGAGLVLREVAELMGYEIANLTVVERVATTLGFFFALIVVGYVGVLFAQTVRSLWEVTLLLPWLFMASALSTGIAALVIVLRIVPTNERPEVLTQLERLDVVFIVVELVLLVIFLIWLAAAGPTARAALGNLIGGGIGILFWVGLVILGLLVPLALEWRALRSKVTTPAVTVGAPALVLLGGLVLRYVIVFAGQA